MFRSAACLTYLYAQRSKSGKSLVFLVPASPALPPVLPEGVVADGEPRACRVPVDHVLGRLLPVVVPDVGIRSIGLRKQLVIATFPHSAEQSGTERARHNQQT